MSEKQTADGDVLFDRLRTEAASDAPVFSSELHDRIMSKMSEPVSMPINHPMRLPLAVPLARAAAILLALGPFLVFSRAKQSQQPPHTLGVNRTLPSVPSIPNPVRELDQTMLAMWTGDKTRSIDRDGAQLLDYMARQLDVTPPKR